MANGKDERHNPNRKPITRADRTSDVTFDMGGGARIERILSPDLQKHLEYTKREESDAESAYRVAMDNDGVDTPQKFDKNTDGW
jgi:hypothetical protein